MGLPRLSQLRLNILSGAATTIGSAAVSLVSYPVNLAYVGYEVLGLWIILGTVVSAAQLGNLGVSVAATKYVAEEHGRGDHGALAREAATAWVILGLVGVLVAVGAAVGRAAITRAFGLTGEAARQVEAFVPWMGVLSACALLNQAQVGVLTGLGRMDQANYVGVTAQIAGFATNLVLFQFGLGLGAIVTGATVSTALRLVATGALARRIVGRPLFRPRDASWTLARKQLSFGAPMLGATVISLLLQPFNRLMVSRYVGVASLPLLEIAYTGGMQLRSLVESGLRALTPEISRAVGAAAAELPARVRHLARKGLILQVATGVALFGGAILVAEPLLRLWLRSRFVPEQVPIFRIMMLGCFASLLGVAAYYLLLGLGRVKGLFAVHLVQAVLNAAVVTGILVLSGRLLLQEVGWGWLAGASMATFMLLILQRRAITARTGSTAS
jgi:O-antigen/teichoic acid export membrane protein